MKKLSLYLSPSHYEKIQALLGTENEEEIEGFINNSVYEAIDHAWLQKRGEDIKKMLEADDDETKFVTIDSTEYEIWSDGDMAVISFYGEDYVVQMIEGKMHYVLENGMRIECSKETQEALEKVLAAASMNIKDYSIEELNEPIIYKGEKQCLQPQHQQ